MASGRLAPKSGSGRQRDSRLRKKVEKVLDDLVWLIETWPPDQQNMVLTPERIDRLVSALLTVHIVDLRPRIEGGKDLERLIERQYQIAAMIMEKGAAKCLEAFERKEQESPPYLGMDSPLYRLVMRDAGAAIDVLNYVATGVGGIDVDYHFHPDRYKPKPAPAKRESQHGRKK